MRSLLLHRNKKRIIDFLALLCISLIALSVHAQSSPTVLTPQLKNQIVKKTNCLPNAEVWRSTTGFVNDMLIDKKGIMWIATNNGLLRWDGNHKLVFNTDPKNPFQLQADKINAIFQGRDGAILLETQKANLQIEVLEKGSVQSKPITKNRDGNIVSGYLTDISISSEELIHAAFNEGNRLVIYEVVADYLLQKAIVQLDHLVDQRKIKIAFHEQAFWISVEDSGLWRVANKGVPQKVMDYDQKDQQLTYANFLISDQSNQLWLGLNGIDNNIFLWQGNQFKNFTTPIKKSVNYIKEGQKGELLFISGKYPRPIDEVFFYDGKQWTDFSTSIDSSSTAIFSGKDIKSCFFQSTLDNIQSITYSENKVQQYLKSKEVKNQWGNIIKGINEDLQGNIYFLSEVYDFYKLNKSTGEIQKIPILNNKGTELSFQCGGAIHRDKKGNLWFKICDGRGNGTLVKFNPETELFKLYNHNQLIRDIAISEDGKIWVVHHSDKDKRGKLSYFDPAQEQFQPSNVDVDFPEPRFCYADGDSILWIGTLKGLVKINRLKKTSAIYTTENTTMPNDRIIVIGKGPKEQLLLGTFGKGLMLFDPQSKRVKAFNEESGLVNNYVCGVLPIDENRYWLSTFRGLSYFDSEKSLFYNYKAKDGFTNNEFNRYAFYQASDGTNYFGTINGANAFQTQNLEPIKKENNIGISAIRKYFGNRDETDLLNYNLDDIKSIELPTDLTYIEVDFHQKSFTQSAPQHFYTRLLPIDKEWTFLRNRESARYRTLPPGEYTLEVLGSQSPNPLRLDILSKAPFHKTLLFNTLVIALGLMGIFLFARNRSRKAQEEALSKEINNRKIAELKLTALQAQMNPHFIFNALGAIQYFIQVNEVEAADHYLTRFAQLMRKYLDSSKEKLISLKKEIELLKIYVDLERLRFSESFDFTLEVGQDLEPEDIYLPSMMIQPFIENAVNHGLNQRQDGKGLLLIRFSKKENNLHCEIIDNGIGYKNAQKNKRKGHQSRGMIIINEKINSLLNAGIMEIEVKTSEWDSSNTAFPGTRVLLEIKNFEND